MFDIFIYCFVGEHFAHFSFTAWIANSCCSAAHKRNAMVTVFTQVAQRKEWNHVADVKAWTGWVASYIKSNRTFIHFCRKTVNVSTLREKSAFLQCLKCFVHFKNTSNGSSIFCTAEYETLY